MTQDPCQKAFFLASRADRTADEEQWLAEHLARCDTCRRDLDHMTALAELVRNTPVPPPSDTEVSRYVDMAVNEQPRHILPVARRNWVTTIAAACLAAFFLVGGIWWFGLHPENDRSLGHSDSPRNQSREPRRVAGKTHHKGARSTEACPNLEFHVQGTWRRLACPGLQACPATDESTGVLPHVPWSITTGSTPLTLLAFSQKVRIVLAPNTEFADSEQSGLRFELKRGTLYVSVDHDSGLGRCFRLDTPNGTLTILGTRFLATVENRALVVRTYEGVVRFAPVKGQPTVVRSEEQLTMVLGYEPHVRRVETHGGKDPRKPPEWVDWRDVGSSRRIRPAAGSCSLHTLRALGRKSARRALAAANACHETSRLSLEGEMLRADLTLSAGNPALAAKIYHRIARRGKGRTVGQNALFSAGQVELTRLGRKARALRTFNTYLKWYPSGRYAADVRRVIKSIQRSSQR